MTSRAQGRPPATSHGAIEEAAFRLFDERGFEATTMDDIAAELRIARRTLFRYYPSKNDIPWGQFDDSLRGFTATFRDTAPDVPIPQAIRDAVVGFNSYPDLAHPQHRRRMRLLLGTPALRGHSELRYAAWRGVVSAYVASRLGTGLDDLHAVVAGRVALAVALSTYEVWLETEGVELGPLMAEAFDDTAAVLGESVGESVGETMGGGVAGRALLPPRTGE